MINQKKEYKVTIGGKEIIIESGRLAKQADGAVLVTCGKTQVLVAACSAKEAKDGQDFFPLAVDYIEKFYSAGKFLGGFIKREGKPSTQETLNARLIDRPIRPMFPEGYMNETMVTAIVVSYDPEGDPEVLAGIGASAALSISDIPFTGSLGSCKVGRIDGKFVINPAHADWPKSDFEIAVSASKDAILMVEGEAKEVPEAEVLEAIMFAHENIKEICKTIDRMQKEIGKPKRNFTPTVPEEKVYKKIEEKFNGEARKLLSIKPKLERGNALFNLEQMVKDELKKNPAHFGLSEDSDFKKEAKSNVDKLLYNMMRSDILNDEKRIGGRKLDEVRQIETEVDLLKVPHGSSLFTRGETQVMAITTIGGSVGDQMADRITGITYTKFYLHYNFPPFSVGEAKGKYSVGRRELGHGNLAERAIKAVIPTQEEFAYTVRVCCEVLESNGSSSMGSVCSASMSLMDAGVPLKAPVAGIAMGLVSDGKRFKILTDILGDEDHLGDMDFKVAGTTKGVTAIQMDIKITGITEEIIKDALKRAHNGRMHILGEMSKSISTHRKVLKDGVPRIETFVIDKEKIGALIGPGGKNIRALQETYGVTIECAEDGTVRVVGNDINKINACVEVTDMQLNGPKVGSIYKGKVVTLKDYGAFIDIVPGVSGLVHISEIAKDRIKDIRDYLAEGDEITVKVLDVDRMGRMQLSARAISPVARKDGKAETAASQSQSDQTKVFKNDKHDKHDRHDKHDKHDKFEKHAKHQDDDDDDL